MPEEVRRKVGIRLGTKLVDGIGKEYVSMKKVERTLYNVAKERFGLRLV